MAIADGEDKDGGLTRRSLLRIGAHAAWTAPIITAVVAAPAYAVSVTAFEVRQSQGKEQNSVISFRFALHFTGSVLASGITIVLELPSAYGALSNAIPNQNVASATLSGRTLSLVLDSPSKFNTVNYRAQVNIGTSPSPAPAVPYVISGSNFAPVAGAVPVT